MLYGNPHDSRSLYQITFKQGKYVGEVANKRKNGQLFISLLSASILRDVNGAVLGIVGVSRDITGRKQAEEKLHYLSFHDILTGIHNRAYLEKEWERVNQARHFPVSVIVADVDELKKTNDRLGHAVGDELLRQVGALLTSTFRSEDVIARIGGDEFVVLLPGLATLEAEEALARLRNNVANYNSTHPAIFPSLSLGVAAADQTVSLVEVLREADKRMYEDKTKSRVSATAIAGSATIHGPAAFPVDIFA
jgi:diguanylate cyclase (GGDEF)-like protein